MEGKDYYALVLKSKFSFRKWILCKILEETIFHLNCHGLCATARNCHYERYPVWKYTITIVGSMDQQVLWIRFEKLEYSGEYRPREWSIVKRNETKWNHSNRDREKWTVYFWRNVKYTYSINIHLHVFSCALTGGLALCEYWPITLQAVLLP